MTLEKPKRSEKMSRAEFRAFQAWVKSQETDQLAADALSISRTSLDRIYALGSGKPATIKKIREVITVQLTE